MLSGVGIALDFFCKNVWTLKGKRLAVHPPGSRKVFVSPSTYHPDEAWVKQQARNVTIGLDDEGLEADLLLHDRDTKFSKAIDHLFRSASIDFIKTPCEAPVAHCDTEPWIGC